MSIDASIALQGKLPQFDNPLTQYAQVAAIQQAQQQNRLAELTYGDKQRETEQTNALNNIYKGAVGADGAIDRNKLYTGAASGGLGAKIPGLQKGFAETDKAVADLAQSKSKTAETDGKLAQQRQEAIGGTLGAIAQIPNATPQHVVTGIQHLVDIGQIAPEMAQKIIAGMPQDPAQLKPWLEQGRDAVMKASELKKYTTVDANAKLAADTSIKVGEGNNRTAIQVGEGNNRTAVQVGASHDAVSREGQGKPVWDADRGVFVDPRTGLATTAVGTDGKPLGAKDKPLTETQGKATGFAARAQEADKLISSMDGKYSPAAINSKASVENTPMVGGMLGALVNSTTLSTSDQRAEQAQRDFINAVLRQESGAAIGKDEFNNARKQYFTQPGDDDATKAQKATNRRLAVEALRTQAGPGAKQIDGMVETSNKPAVKRVEEAVKNGVSGKLAGLKPVSVQTAADYAKLPSGTVYTAPDGSQRTKQ